jgi:hypothetical protein
MDQIMRGYVTGVAVGAAISVFISPHWIHSRSMNNAPLTSNINTNENQSNKTGQKISIGTRLYLQGRVAIRSGLLFGAIFSIAGAFRC